MTWLLRLAVVIAGGFGRRFAGGLLAQWVGPIGGTQVARMVQAGIAGAAVWALGAPWQWVAGVVPLTFLGALWGFPSLLPRWPFINWKSNMVPTTGLDTLSLSINGIIACAPLALGAWWLDLSWGWLVAAGATRGPLYWVADAHTPPWRWMGFEEWAADQNRWILVPTALTEFYAGCALHAAFISIMVDRAIR